MKRLYILASLLLLASSCVREEQAMNPESSVDPTVPIVLSFQEPVTLEARTRAGLGTEMGVTPAIESIHVAVFGSSGYLKDYASAVPCDQYGNTSGAGYADKNYTGTDSETTTASSSYFLVRLQANLEESLRTVHVIANGPSSLPFNAGEKEIMKSMSVKDGNGAYWQRIVLPKGILATQEDGAYEAIDEVKNAFTGITLVRNFASVTVKETASNFYLESIILCNMPKSGSVAMYSDNHGDWIYSAGRDTDCPGDGCTNPYHGMLWSAYEKLSPNQYDEEHPETFNNGFPEGFIVYADNNGASHSYGGFPLNPELDTYIPSTAEDYAAAGLAVSASATDETQPYNTEAPPVYVYERAVTGENPPFILLKGTWVNPEGKNAEEIADDLEDAVENQTSSYYYRLDITRDSDYVPIYRNYQYNITITGVELKGYDTPGEAALHSSGDNFSVALDTEILADVSNGKIHLFVEKPFIDLTYTSEPQKFWFRLLRNSNKEAINDASHVTITEKEGGNALASFSRNIPDVDVDADGDGNAKERWVTFTLDPTEFGETESMRSSTLKIVGSYKEPGVDKTYKLVREVTIRVYNPKYVQLSLNPETVAAQEGEETTLGIPLPLNLQRSMFPLEITVWDEDKSLNPADSELMPVTSEKSLYSFVYTLNWSRYERLRDNAERAGEESALLTCDLKTILTSEQYLASQDYDTQITASCRYFRGSAVLYVDGNNLITPSKQTVVPPDREASVTVKSETPWSLSLTHADGTAVVGAVISPSTGAVTTGTGTPVTITLPESSASNIHYIVTMTNATVTRTAAILQQGTSIMLKLTEDAYDTDGETPLKIPHGTGPAMFPHTVNDNSIVDVTSGVNYYLEVCDPNGRWWESPVRSPDEDETLYIPVNNTIAERNLIIRARDTHQPYILCSNEITLIQEAGIATLTVNTPNLMLFESEASVNVSSSFPVVLKVFDSNGDEISGILVKDASNQEVGTTGGDDPVLLAANTAGANYTLVLPANLSGAAETLTVKLFNTDDVELRSGSIVHAGTPVMTLTEDQLIAGNVLSCNLTIVSDEAWRIAAANGEMLFSVDGSTPSGNISGNPTTGTTITVTLPSKNYNYANGTYGQSVLYPVTAESTESGSELEATATITHRGAINNSTSAPFNTQNKVNGGLYYDALIGDGSYTATVGHIIGTFAPTNKVTLAGYGDLIQGNNYVILDHTGCTLTLTRQNTVNVEEVRAITGINMTFTGSNYTPTEVKVNNSTSGVSGQSWSGEDTGDSTVISLYNGQTYDVFFVTNYYDIHMTGFTVTYDYLTW